MRISLISAMSQNRIIGNKGRLPWGHLPADWANLERVTANAPMVMGRKSYDTPDRVWSRTAPNIVLTQQKNYILEPGFERAQSLAQAFEILKSGDWAEVFFIGGSEIFNQTLSVADTIYLTRVEAIFEGDATFPEIDLNEWALLENKTFPADERHAYAYTFQVFERIRPHKKENN
jgi:dihydrofolate reductase